MDPTAKRSSLGITKQGMLKAGRVVGDAIWPLPSRSFGRCWNGRVQLAATHLVVGDSLLASTSQACRGCANLLMLWCSSLCQDLPDLYVT